MRPETRDSTGYPALEPESSNSASGGQSQSLTGYPSIDDVTTAGSKGDTGYAEIDQLYDKAAADVAGARSPSVTAAKRR